MSATTETTVLDRMPIKKIPQEVGKFKIIAEDQVPVRLRRRSQVWLGILKSIPRGKALVATEEELGITAASLREIVKRFRKSGMLSKSYHLTQRSEGEKATIYIIHSAKTTE